MTATGEHQKSGTKRVIYERLIAYPDCCYLMVGMVGEEQGDEFLPEFQNMAKGFSRNSPIESGAVAGKAVRVCAGRWARGARILATSVRGRAPRPAFRRGTA